MERLSSGKWVLACTRHGTLTTGMIPFVLLQLFDLVKTVDPRRIRSGLDAGLPSVFLESFHSLAIRSPFGKAR